MVPYSKVDEAIKKANRDTASETVRTLLVYGYNLDPPTGEGNEALLAEALRQKYAAFRTYRVERNYAVTSGKWYFEFEVLTAGPMRVSIALDIIFQFSFFLFCIKRLDGHVLIAIQVPC